GVQTCALPISREFDRSFGGFPSRRATTLQSFDRTRGHSRQSNPRRERSQSCRRLLLERQKIFSLDLLERGAFAVSCILPLYPVTGPQQDGFHFFSLVRSVPFAREDSSTP